MTKGIKSNEPDARIVYADIIRLPHWQLPTRKPMSAYERAAQFSSFNALEGYEDMVGEEAREVGQMETLTESEMEVLNQKINLISDVLEDGHHPVLKFTYGKSFHYKKGDRLSYEETAREISKISGINFAIAALPLEFDEEDYYDDSVASPYDSFKKVFADLGIPSQMVSLSMVKDLGSNNVKYRLQNLILGLLCKSGGIPWILEAPMDGVDCFIGLDVGTQEKGIHYPACSVCLDGRGNLVGYYSTNVAQRGEIIDVKSLETIFNRVLTAYKEANGCYPKHIVIHRDGFSHEESAWYDSYFGRRDIKFDVVEVRKNIPLRLIDTDAEADEMNPASGSAIIKENEAYLISTAVKSFLGAPRPLLLVHQKGQLSMESIVRQIYVLSEMHIGSMRTSRLPLTTLYSLKKDAEDSVLFCSGQIFRRRPFSA